MDAARDLAIDMGIGPGDVVAGKYRVVRVIGHGGMGVVVEAIHEALDVRVAIKFLRPEAGGDAEAAGRFLMEAKALAHFKSVHIARVTDISHPHEEVPYFVMEYLDGHDLGAALAVDGTLAVTTAVDYALQVCEALAEAYTAGIVHRDIKPANLFLTLATDGSTLVKLLDFGISKHNATGDAPALNVTRTRSFMGSPRYMAPEQMRSMRRVDHRVDIWSLGVVLHESLTGQPPFVGETLPEVCAAIAADDPVRVRQLRRDVPIELQDVILRCLAKDPDQRYPDVGKLALDLAPFASPDAAVTARRIGRIIKGPSVRPARPVVQPGAATPEQSPAGDDDYAALPQPLPASFSMLPARVDEAKAPLRRWVLLVLIIVAVPAFIVGALVAAPPLAPEPRVLSSASASPSSSVRADGAVAPAHAPGTASSR